MNEKELLKQIEKNTNKLKLENQKIETERKKALKEQSNPPQKLKENVQTDINNTKNDGWLKTELKLAPAVTGKAFASGLKAEGSAFANLSNKLNNFSDTAIGRTLETIMPSSSGVKAVANLGTVALNSKATQNALDNAILKGTRAEQTKQQIRSEGGTEFYNPIRKEAQTTRNAGGFVIDVVSQQLPMLATAILTKGRSLGKGAEKATGNLIKKTVAKIIDAPNNPAFFVSFQQILGSTYESELESGASEEEALRSAFANAYLGSVVEVGSGAETLLSKETERGLKNAIKDILKASGEEGLEEIKQYAIEGATNKALGSNTAEFYSNNPNEQAIINPSAMAIQGGAGALGGALLGGAGVGFNSILKGTRLDSQPAVPTVEERRNNVVNDLQNVANANEDKYNELATKRDEIANLVPDEEPKQRLNIGQEIANKVMAEPPVNNIGTRQRVKTKGNLPQPVRSSMDLNAIAEENANKRKLNDINKDVEKAEKKFKASVEEVKRVANMSDDEFIEYEKKNGIAPIPSEKTVVPDKVSEKKIQKIYRGIEKRSGVKIVEEDIPSKDGKLIDGYYQNGVIHVNKNAENKIQVVLTHELTHYLENSDSYNDYVKFLKDIVQKYGNEEEIKNNIKEIYGEIDEDTLEREFVAFVSQDLLDDPVFLRRLARENTTVFNKILDWIHDTIRMVKSYAVGESEYMKSLIELEKKFNAMLDTVSEVKKGNKQYIQIGVNAELNAEEYEAFEEAVEMKGMPNTEIKKQTGWVEGPEGLFRFKIDDSNAKLLIDIEKAKLNTEYKLKDILQHDELYKRYPRFADMRVAIVKMDDPLTAGSYNNKLNLVEINKDYFSKKNSSKAVYKGNKGVVATIIHEIQHAIQKIEYFLEGGDPHKIRDEIEDVVRDSLSRKGKDINASTDSKVFKDELYEIYKSRDIDRLAIERYYFLFGEEEARNEGDKYYYGNDNDLVGLEQEKLVFPEHAEEIDNDIRAVKETGIDLLYYQPQDYYESEGNGELKTFNGEDKSDSQYLIVSPTGKKVVNLKFGNSGEKVGNFDITKYEGKEYQGRESQGIRGSWGKFYREFVNSTEDIERIGKRLKSDQLSADVQSVRTSSSTARHIIFNNLVDNTGKKISDKSLATIFKEIPEDAKKDFEKYKYALHDLDRIEQGSGIYGKESTKENAQAVVDEMLAKHPEFEKLNDEFNSWWKSFKKSWLVDTGLISEETSKLWDEKYPNYVPTFREATQGRGVGTSPQSVLKKAKGSETRNLLTLEDQFAGQVNRIVQAARKNELHADFIQTLLENPNETSQYGSVNTKGIGKEDLDEIFDGLDEISTDSTKRGGTKITAYIKGKAYTATVNDDVARAFNVLEKAQESNLAVTIGNKILNPMKFTITGGNPVFAISNMMRDLPTFLVQSKHGLFKSVTGIGKALDQMITKGDLYKQYKALGGGEAGYYVQGKGFSSNIDGNKLFDKVKKIAMALGETTETLPRLAEFINSIEKYGNSEKAVKRAMNDAAEVTVNFSRNGKTTKALDSWVLYLNAAVQGLDKFGRTLAKHPVITAGRSIALIATPYLLLSLFNWDNPWYKDLSNRTRQNYFCIPNLSGEKDEKGNCKTFIKVPLNREYGTIFGGSLDCILKAVEGEEDAWNGFRETVDNNFLPPNLLTDNVLAPFYYNIPNNKDFANRAIIPSSLQKASPRNQYDSTSSEFAKMVGELASKVSENPAGKALEGIPIIGKSFSYLKSPKLVDYLLDSYAGYYGDLAQTFGKDKLVKGLTIEPYINKFKADARYSSQAVANFYDQYERVETMRKDEELAGKEWGEAHAVYKALGKIADKLTDSYKLEKEILANDKLSKEKKDELIKDLREERNDLANSAGKVAKDASAEYENSPTFSEMKSNVQAKWQKGTGLTKEQWAKAYIEVTKKGSDDKAIYSRDYEKVYALMDNDVKKYDQVLTYDKGISKNTYEEAKRIHDLGITLDEIDKIYNDANTDGKGLSKKEIEAYMKGTSYSKKEKAAIFDILMRNPTTKNPYK